MSTFAAIALAAPWILAPIVTALRVRGSRSLDEYPPGPPDDAPVVSIIIPARDEAPNIERCVRSALASDYPALEVVAVDDHSTDGTGEILRAIALSEDRLRVVVPEALPAGWFGKQWACTAGQKSSAGEIFGFLDADTWQTPDLVPRVVRAMTARGADLLTVGGRQELGTFWERLLQPQVFSMMLVRYGGTESVNASRRASDKIANGQCLFIRRDAYEAMGGHAAVRDKVAEDLALAQRFFVGGRRTVLVLGLDQLSTRMYTSLGEIVLGWGKNIYAGGRDAMPFGAAGRWAYPLLLMLPALMQVMPPVVLCLSLGGAIGSGAFLWAAIVTITNVLWWVLVYGWLKLSPLYVLLHPIGAALMLYIALYSIVRGRRVRWKGRDYVST